MDRSPLPPPSRGIALLLALLVVLAVVPGVAAAESRSGGTVVVAEGETIDENLEAFGGTIVVHGTVNGDLSAFGGDVLVTGDVTGDVSVFAGNVHELSLPSSFPKMAAMEAEHGGLVKAMIARMKARKAAKKEVEARRARGEDDREPDP